MLGVNVVDEGLPKKPPSETATPMAVKRLTMDYKSLIADPLPSIIAHPKPSNILEWHYVIYGSPDTCYDGISGTQYIFLLISSFQADIIMVNLYFLPIFHFVLPRFIC